MVAAEGPLPALSLECEARPAARDSWTLYKPWGQEAPERKREELRPRSATAGFPLQRQHIGRKAAEAH